MGIKLPKIMLQKNELIPQAQLMDFLPLSRTSKSFLTLKYSPQLIDRTHWVIKKYITQLQEPEELKEYWFKLNDVIRECFLHKDIIHLISYPTGKGKTGTIILWIICFNYYTCNLTIQEGLDGIVVLSSDYKNGVNELETQIKKFAGWFKEYIRFEGKPQLCRILNKKINENGTTIQQVCESGQSLNYWCKKKCPEKNSCKYKKNTKFLLISIGNGTGKRSFWIGVSHQLNAFLPIFLMKRENVILITDESISNGLKINFRPTLLVLEENLNLLKELIELEKKKDSLILWELECYYNLLAELKNGLEKDMDYNKLTDLLAIFLPDISTINKLDSLSWNKIQKNRQKLEYFLFYNLDSFLTNFLYEMENNPKTYKKWVKTAITKIINKEKPEKTHISFLFYDKSTINNIVDSDRLIKWIMNDATPERNILKAILKSKIIEHTLPLDNRNKEFYQLQKITGKKNKPYAEYPKDSIQHANTFNLLLDDILATISAFPEQEKILIQCRETFLPFANIVLSRYLPAFSPKIIFRPYPLKATNEFKDVNVVIVLGVPELPPSVLKRESILLNVDEEKYRKDNIIDLVVQGIGRIFRGTNLKHVIFLTGFDFELKEINIKTFNSHSSLKKYFENVAESKGIEVVSTKDTIFDKILNFLKENNNEIGLEDYMSLFSVSKPTASTYLNKYLKEKKLKFKAVYSLKTGQPKSMYFI